MWLGQHKTIVDCSHNMVDVYPTKAGGFRIPGADGYVFVYDSQPLL